MAAPLYMLVVAGERAEFRRPLNYDTDRYVAPRTSGCSAPSRGDLLGREQPR